MTLSSNRHLAPILLFCRAPGRQTGSHFGSTRSRLPDRAQGFGQDEQPLELDRRIRQQVTKLGLIKEYGITHDVHSLANGIRPRMVAQAHKHDEINAPAFGQPMDKWRKEMGFNRTPKIGSLQIIGRSQTVRFGDKSLYAAPVANIFDDRVRVDEIKTGIRDLAQIACIAAHRVKRGSWMASLIFASKFTSVTWTLRLAR